MLETWKGYNVTVKMKHSKKLMASVTVSNRLHARFRVLAMMEYRPQYWFNVALAKVKPCTIVRDY